MPKFFRSNISGKEFPIDEMIHANTVAHSILKEIQKEHPRFNKQSLLSFSELNLYRQKYIEAYLINESGQLSELDNSLLKEIQKKALVTDQLADEKGPSPTFGQQLADQVAHFGGSWKFLIAFGIFLVIWMIVNTIILASKPFDPYPFILLNLILSSLAALQAPVIMMSQNRQEEKDRENSKKDYMVNLTSELEIRLLHDKIDQMKKHQQEELVEIQQIQMEMMREILTKIDQKPVTKA